MSRHIIPHEALEIVVGFDGPMQTFFGQVFDRRQDEEDAEVLWIGVGAAELRTVEALVSAMKDYITIPPDLVETLRSEAASAPLPTRLQFAVRGLFS